MWMSAGDDQISLDDSSSFPDQVAVNRSSMSVSIFPRELGPLSYFLLSSSSGHRGSLFFPRILARRCAPRGATVFRPVASVSMRGIKGAAGAPSNLAAS
jgi:hypothetical protein